VSVYKQASEEHGFHVTTDTWEVRKACKNVISHPLQFAPTSVPKASGVSYSRNTPTPARMMNTHTYMHMETRIRAHGHTPMVLSVVDMELSRLSMELLCVACRLEMLLPRALDDITVLGSCLEESE